MSSSPSPYNPDPRESLTPEQEALSKILFKNLIGKCVAIEFVRDKACFHDAKQAALITIRWFNYKPKEQSDIDRLITRISFSFDGKITWAIGQESIMRDRDVATRNTWYDCNDEILETIQKCFPQKTRGVTLRPTAKQQELLHTVIDQYMSDLIILKLGPADHITGFDGQSLELSIGFAKKSYENYHENQIGKTSGRVFVLKPNEKYAIQGCGIKYDHQKSGPYWEYTNPPHQELAAEDVLKNIQIISENVKPFPNSAFERNQDPDIEPPQKPKTP
jgi:hypothetical protein